MTTGTMRSRWAAIGAAIAVTLGAGGIGVTQATTSSGERAIYKPISPCRLADFRPAPDQVGNRDSPLGANETVDLSGWGDVGQCELPARTAGLALNVTALGATAPTFLTLFPAGVDRPNASNLNATPGQPPTPNAVNVDLNVAGMFSIYNLQGNVNIIIDVVGIYDDHDHNDLYYTKDRVDRIVDPLVSPVGQPDAMAAVDQDGFVIVGQDDVAFVFYNEGKDRYEITLNDINFSVNEDIAMVTPRGTDTDVHASYSSAGNSLLLVTLRRSNGNAVRAPFSFVIWDTG